MGKYIITISFTADVDFNLPEKIKEGEIENLLEEIERTPTEELEEGVYQRLSFLLCRPCKKAFATRPFGQSAPEKEGLD